MLFDSIDDENISGWRGQLPSGTAVGRSVGQLVRDGVKLFFA